MAIDSTPNRRPEGHSPRHWFGRLLRLLRHFRPGPSGKSCRSNLVYERQLTPFPTRAQLVGYTIALIGLFLFKTSPEVLAGYVAQLKALVGR